MLKARHRAGSFPPARRGAKPGTIATDAVRRGVKHGLALSETLKLKQKGLVEPLPSPWKVGGGT